MFESIVAFSLINFGLVMLILALFFSAIQWTTQQRLASSEIFYRWIILLPVGVTALYAFFMHVFHPDVAAGTIGWQNNPFQYEVGMANLAFGTIAVLSFKASYEFRLATVIATTIWLWGDATGHIYQMVHQHNFSAGNAGSWFWLDVIIPFILITCISNLKPRYLNY